MSRFLLAHSIISLPLSLSLSLYTISRYREESKFTIRQPRPTRFTDLKFPRSFILYSVIYLELILYIIFIERTSRKMIYTCIHAIYIYIYNEHRCWLRKKGGGEGIPSGGTLLSTLHGVRLMLPRSYSRGVVPLLANNNTR